MGPYMVLGEVLEVGFFVRAALLPSLYPSYHALASHLGCPSSYRAPEPKVSKVPL